jgi:5'-deoxynucleotidase YfbR-like HD superfamily hydrolase
MTIDITSVVNDLDELTGATLKFASINRTGPFWPDKVTPESDTDHTVHVGWLACCLADRFYPFLDVGLVASYSLVHDGTEIHAGDTPTLMGLTDAEGSSKARREEAAMRQLLHEFNGGAANWFARMVLSYEANEHLEARFVKAVDKIAPKLVHLHDGCTQLIADSVTTHEWSQRLLKQRIEMEQYLPRSEFPMIYHIHHEVGRRLILTLEAHYG